MLRWCYWIEIGKDRSTLGNPAHADLRVVFSRKLKALLTSIWCRTRGPSHFPKSIILLVWPTVSPFFVKQKKGWINNQSNLYLVRFVSSYRKIIWQVQENWVLCLFAEFLAEITSDTRNWLCFQIGKNSQMEADLYYDTNYTKLFSKEDSWFSLDLFEPNPGCVLSRWFRFRFNTQWSSGRAVRSLIRRLHKICWM